MSCDYVLDTYHIIVLEASTSLEKPCHSKCIVLHRSMWHSMSIVLKPKNPVANRHSPILGGGESRSRGRERTEMANLLKVFNDEVHINIPAIPVLSPKHRFVRRLWLPPITVITIASIDLHNPCTTQHNHGQHDQFDWSLVFFWSQQVCKYIQILLSLLKILFTSMAVLRHQRKWSILQCWKVHHSAGTWPRAHPHWVLVPCLLPIVHSDDLHPQTPILYSRIHSQSATGAMIQCQVTVQGSGFYNLAMRFCDVLGLYFLRTIVDYHTSI